MKHFHSTRGTSFLDVIIGSALLLLIFIAIAGTIQLAVRLTGHTKAKVGATALANEQVEFLRSLNYDDVGTVGGIPPGNVPQEEEIFLNNITYTRHTLVQYIDDPADGLLEDDENGIPTDYKVAKVTVEWSIGSVSKTTSFVSNIVPPGIETNEGGGTLFLTVFDALGIPVEDADVRIVNTDVDPTIDVTRSSDSSGRVIFPGSPSAGSYEITVSRPGYSTAETYDVDATNPNPNPGHLTVAEAQTTSAGFAIDVVGEKTVRTFSPPEPETWEDMFNDDSLVATFSNTEVVVGTLRLLDLGGTYPTSGTARSVAIAPSDLYSWSELSWNDVVVADTNIIYRVYSGGALIPDADLPGNTTGFSTSPVDISGLDPATYPSIELGATLATTNTLVTPELSDWTVEYMVGPLPLPNIAFTLRGDKTIGTDGGGAPIYKYEATLQTDSSGEHHISSLEWDTYALSIDSDALGLTIAEICPFQPYALDPGVSVTTDILLVPQMTHSLMVSVEDVSGTVLPGASVRLYRTGYDETEESSSCGQVFFEDLSEGTTKGGNAYALDVSASGYQDQTITNVDVSGAATLRVILQPSP